jgi:hypothetical protein
MKTVEKPAESNHVQVAEKPVPAYRKHKQSAQAIVTLTDGLGSRKDVLLGRYGTAASRQEYAKVIAEWEASDRHQLQVGKNAGKVSDITVAELLDRYWPWAKKYYRRPEGAETQEVSGLIYALRPLKYLYANTLAGTFGPLALKAVRDLMIRGYDHPKYGPQTALARSHINQRIKRIRRVFK